MSVAAEPPARINLTDPALYSHGNPFPVWRWLRAHDPVRWQQESELPGFWIVTRYEDVRAVYRDPDTFSSAGGILLRPAGLGADPGGGRTLALTDPPRHRQLRALVDGWFTVRSVRALEAEMTEVAQAVVARAIDQGRCDFVTEIAARIPLYVICKMTGVPAADWEHIFDLTSEAFGAADALARRLAHLEILRYFEDLKVARAKNPGDDLVSALATAKIDGKPLTPDEIILNCDNLLVGGTENTRIAASGGMLAFLENPGEWQDLAEDPALFPTAVEEVLRWTSSATHIMRTATRPVILRGRHIEAGDRVTLWNPSANRDEAVFENPDRFTIRRQPNRHLALGAGEHFCLGSTLARFELRILYQELLRRVRCVELDGEPVRLSSIVVNGLQRLPVNLVPA
ncbi:MAG TPA: cytochrome P450 [Streptosporangiaceae bacterium]|jgi:cytochrome P450|nr:cytochrome P450 [Streptosporangiaceae bacterium]